MAVSSDSVDDSFIETLHAGLKSLSSTITADDTSEEVVEPEDTTASLEQTTAYNADSYCGKKLNLEIEQTAKTRSNATSPSVMTAGDVVPFLLDTK